MDPTTVLVLTTVPESRAVALIEPLTVERLTT